MKNLINILKKYRSSGNERNHIKRAFEASTIASYVFIDVFHNAQNSVFSIICAHKILVDFFYTGFISDSFPNLKFSLSLGGRNHTCN